MLSNPLVITAVVFVLLGLVFLILSIAALNKKKIIGTAMSFVIALLMISLAVLFAVISVAVQGYHALTKEELAAIVKIEPAGEQKFIAQFTMPDGEERVFSLSGDQVYVDAHILKWKPLANILGLHTSYELDRVAGRYTMLIDETSKARTVFSLSKNRAVDMFDLRRRFAFLNPLLDAEYGSATFINSTNAEEFRLMVSTTGLLIRKRDDQAAQ
jgi:hypothetical protein